eukprot:102435-Pleurochrysis_carterae.AAC.1
MVLLHVKTHGSECDCLKPHDISYGNSDRCQRRPAWAMPYTGLTTRHTRVLPSDPVVSYPGGGVAVHDFAWLELALQVRGDEIPGPHGESASSSERSKRPKRCGAHRGAERLFKVHSGYLGATLNTEPGFERTVALTFVDPDQAHK